MGPVIPGRRVPPRRRPTGWLVLVVLLVVAAVVFVAWRQRQPPPDDVQAAAPSSSPAPDGTPSFDEARRLLNRLPVRGWDRHTDFSRYRFGEAWSDDVNVEFGHNGCNTRDDILRRDLVDLVVRPGSCYAQSGVLHDPYTGATIDFVRGPDTSPAVQIDHLVSLSDAWYKGAREWDDQRRRDFANDPRNLVAVAGQANFDKAFRDVSSWLPPNSNFRCEFVARVVGVKYDYQLWVSSNEKQAMTAVLDHC